MYFRVRHKQTKYPVMFLTQGVTSKYPMYHDPRCHTIEAAVYFAQSLGILVVIYFKFSFSSASSFCFFFPSENDLFFLFNISVYTMLELKLTGNCLKASRPLLSFDENFSKEPHYQLLKELFVQIFSTPNHHPKSQPFIDHVFTFSILDNKIWFRNYQILSEDGALAEIGNFYYKTINITCIEKGKGSIIFLFFF